MEADILIEPVWESPEEVPFSVMAAEVVTVLLWLSLEVFPDSVRDAGTREVLL